MTQDLDLNGDVDVDSIVDLARRPAGRSGSFLVESDRQKVNLEVNGRVYLNVAVDLDVRVDVEVMVKVQDLVATAGFS